MAALEDALLSAYKKTPGSAKYARVDLDRETADFRVFELILPPELEEKLLAEVAEEQEPDDRPRDGRAARARGARARPRDPRALRGPDRVARRHPRRLRPDRRPDRQAGDPPADPRGRAPDDVRGVPGPRRRAGHRDHPAVRQPLHAGPAARARRGAAASLRAGLQRALRPRHARQGRDHRRLGRGQGPEHRRLAPQPRADQEAVRARGARDRRRAGRDRRRRPRARLPLEDRRRLARRRRRPGRRLRRPARLARPHGRLRAARREDRHHSLQRGARPLRRQGALAGPRPRGPRRRRDQGGDGHRPRRPALAGDRPRGPERPPRRQADRLEGRHQVARPSSPSEDEGIEYEGEEEVADGRCAAVLSAGRRCPNAALDGSRYCGLPQHQALARFTTNQVTVLDAAHRRGGRDARRPRRRRRPRSRAIVERAEAAFDEAEARPPRRPSAEPRQRGRR